MVGWTYGCSTLCMAGHLSDPTFLQTAFPYFKDSKMGCAILEDWKLIQLCTEILNVKDFEGWVHRTVHGCDPPIAGWDRRIGRLTLGNKMVKPPSSSKKDQGLCIIWSILKLQKWHTQFWNPRSKGMQVAQMQGRSSVQSHKEHRTKSVWSPIYIMLFNVIYVK